MDLSTTAGLWLAVMGMGAWHGLNPGMGWPLAVSAALMEGRASALPKAILALGLGHLLAMAVILIPFGGLSLLLQYERELRIGAGVLVVVLGLYLLINRRHPRILARVPPHRLGLWSFLIALTHGAGLMLVPIYLGLCRVEELDAGHRAAYSLMGGNLGMAVAVAVVHTLAMMVVGGAIAVGVHRWLGLRFLSKGWFNLDALWAISLIVVGAIGIWSGITDELPL